IRHNRIFHLKVTMKRRIDKAVHEAHGTSAVIAFQVGEVVVDDHMPGADDPHAAAASGFVPQKEILLDPAVVAMAKREGSRAFEEGVSAVEIFAGLVRDDFRLAVAS